MTRCGIFSGILRAHHYAKLRILFRPAISHQLVWNVQQCHKCIDEIIIWRQKKRIHVNKRKPAIIFSLHHHIQHICSRGLHTEYLWASDEINQVDFWQADVITKIHKSNKNLSMAKPYPLTLHYNAEVEQPQDPKPCKTSN